MTANYCTIILGGLYGRVTWEIKLEPFNLRECELLFRDNGRSLAQNVDDLFFAKGAKLSLEYDRLFASVFIVNMCEMKYYSEEFTVDKDYDSVLRHRKSLLNEMIPKKSAVHSTLITTFGIKHNEYRWDFDNVITMEDLFA